MTGSGWKGLKLCQKRCLQYIYLKPLSSYTDNVSIMRVFANVIKKSTPFFWLPA